MSAFCNHLSILVYRTNSPMECMMYMVSFYLGKTSGSSISSKSKHPKTSYENSGFLEVFSSEIPALRLLWGLTVAYQGQISKGYSKNSFKICTMLWNYCFRKHSAFAFQMNDCIKMFSFGSKKAVLDLGLRGFSCWRPYSPTHTTDTLIHGLVNIAIWSRN